MTEEKYGIPPTEELDHQAIANVLSEWREEFYRDGDDWHAPGDWWNKRIGTLRVRAENRAMYERLGIIEDQ